MVNLGIFSSEIDQLCTNAGPMPGLRRSRARGNGIEIAAGRSWREQSCERKRLGGNKARAARPNLLCISQNSETDRLLIRRNAHAPQALVFVRWSSWISVA